MSEFHLKSSYIDFNHNVMSISTPSFSLTDLAPPVRLFRDSHSIQEQSPSTEPASTPSFGNARKKMQIIEHNDEDDEDQRLREEEKFPWCLEDSEDRTFNGRLEGGQSSSYVLLMKHGDNFHVVPIHKWYKFNPKIQYKTLTLEEAERALSVTHKRQLTDAKHASEVRDESAKGISALRDAIENVTQPSLESAVQPGSKLKVATGNASTLNQNYYSKVYDENDLDFDVDKANFQDDDGDGLYDEMEAVEDSINEPHGHSLRPKPSVAKQYSLSKYGKELKSIMRHTNDPNLHIYFDELEEVKDPYASEPEELEEVLTPIDMKVQNVSQSQEQPLKASSQDLRSTGKKRPLPSSSQSPPPTLSQSSIYSNDTILTEDLVIEFLKKGPTSTKNLVANFRQLIEQNPQNREILTAALKKVAQIKEIVEDGKLQKILELKEEFRVLSGVF